MSSMERLWSALRLAILAISLAAVGVQGDSPSSDLANLTMLAEDSCPLLLVAGPMIEMSCKVRVFRNSTYLNCPREFRCSISRPKDKCVYKGRTYEVNETLPSEYLDMRCRHSCVCRLDAEGYAGFVCKYRKCAQPKPGRRQTYANSMQCCPHANCDPPKADEVTCSYKNKTFTAGEVMVNTFNRTRCICREGFQGVLKAPFCQPVQCGTELDYPTTMRKGCSPVYSVDKVDMQVGKDTMNSVFDFLREDLQDLCPVRWNCPSEGDEEILLTSMDPDVPVLDAETNCVHGSHLLNMLDIVLSTEKPDGSCTMCICVMPPTLLCFHKESCWSF